MTTFPTIPNDWLPTPFSTHPYLFVLAPAVILTFIIFTRLITTLRLYVHSPSSLTPPTLPYSIPLLGHIPGMVGDLQDYLSAQSRRYSTYPAFSLVIGTTKHHVLVAPSLVYQVLIKRENFNKISMKAMIYRLIQTFGGDHNREMEKTLPEDVIFGSIHAVLLDMMREEFVTSALSTTVTAVQSMTPNLISGVSTPIDMELWERAADVQLTQPSPTPDCHPGWRAQANLFLLLRDFVGRIATDVVMGRDFLTNYPSYLSDLWTSEPALPLCMAGVPEWLPLTHAPMAARNRIIANVADHQAAYLKFAKGEDPGSKWGDIEGVSSVMRDRILAWDKAGASIEVGARADAQVLMALNINAPAVIFWMVWYIFSNPTLLQEIRGELTPYVKVAVPSATNGIREPEQIKIDLEGIRKKCPLLQGAYLETLRLEATGLSYKYVTEDVSIKESETDARIFGRSKDDRREYVLRKGDYICIPHIIHNHDERYFPHPQTFDARRFWVTVDGKPWSPDDTESNSKGVKLDYGTMKPWGGGKEMCKGRKFAEGEVLVFAAAVIMLWEIEPADEEPWYTSLGEDLGGVLKLGEKKKGQWKHPGRKHGAGAATPKRIEECRVRLWRRKVGETGVGA